MLCLLVCLVLIRRRHGNFSLAYGRLLRLATSCYLVGLLLTWLGNRHLAEWIWILGCISLYCLLRQGMILYRIDGARQALAVTQDVHDLVERHNAESTLYRDAPSIFGYHLVTTLGLMAVVAIFTPEFLSVF
ncbi:MAG: hypothetical protein ABIB97_02440 [Patescibacteria group bacterium]